MCPDDLGAKGRASLEGGTPWEKNPDMKGEGKRRCSITTRRQQSGLLKRNATTMARGGRAKFKRGGGRNFSKHLELNEEGTAVSTDPKRSKRDAEEDEDEEGDEDDENEEEDSEEEESDDEEGTPAAPALQQQELSRIERKALKKGKKKEAVEEVDEDEDEDPLLANPNRTIGRMKISDLSAPRELTRKEREANEKAEAKEKYMKLHVQGKTEQAQKDLARLAKIRAEREAAQAKRKAEADARAVEIEAKKATGRR
ncbi:casein kinase substrate phosphoprotein PP28-domain-containing protein [Thelephora terrestris]|uniref:Casein kinase substrate phosphoprotein PP28-domain-containing protein n=1 Tax=Thelephora terrestris TaxID=56493 RepID=A0A9P6HFH8_9AGAM|nr:casein kinase substrate phosphoprotein PP28-domain-containing protein [Thelephora terrestris]